MELFWISICIFPVLLGLCLLGIVLKEWFIDKIEQFTEWRKHKKACKKS